MNMQNVIDEAIMHGHEGIVAKRKNSRYVPGKRSRDWLKIKERHTAVCFIVGYKAGKVGVSGLLLAQFEFGMWIYRGTVELGFSANIDLMLNYHEVCHCIPPLGPFRSRKIHWLQPLKCEITYQEMTPTGLFRIPVFRRFLKMPEPEARLLA